MTSQALLIEFTESYLKKLISDVANTLSADFDSHAPFGELGVDSFHALKVVKALEESFGTLSKTLLFENFNVSDLANYFVTNYSDIIERKFSASTGDAVADGSDLSSVETSVEVKRQKQNPKNTTDNINLNAEMPQSPILISWKDGFAHPKLGPILVDIFNQYKNEGSVSRGSRNIAPNLFIGSSRKAYFNYSRYGNILLAYCYTGPLVCFQEVAGEIYQYAKSKNYALNILTDFQVDNVSGDGFSSTPFGAVQRVINLSSFTLKGGKMRRLRYLVNKFEEEGECVTKEYICGSDQNIDKNIAEIIDKWCESRTMVNPLVYVAREEILAGTFSAEHRIFLTYIGDVLQNVIIISEMSPDSRGFLMDLEFYPADMPLGGLEFSIVKIMEILVAEGYEMLSMGATLGPKIAESPNADEQVDKVLDSLREQNIFNDAGNLQFKNKFRPENKSILLCRPLENSDPDNLIDIIMMIANPDNSQSPENENFTPLDTISVHASGNVNDNAQPKSSVENNLPIVDENAFVIDGSSRSLDLADFGFNPLNIPASKVEFDLKTDSWAQLSEPYIDQYINSLYSKLQSPIDVVGAVKAIFPFEYVALLPSGREAERVFFKANQNKGTVLQNLLFPTTIFNQIDNGFTPGEVPSPEVFNLNSDKLFKGGLDLAEIESLLSGSSAITLTVIELNNNAAGGYGVDVSQLAALKKLVSSYGIPLVMDATRIIDNALLLVSQEPSSRELWSTVSELLSYADSVFVSLPKNFAVNKGGLIATNDANLFSHVKALIDEEGAGLDFIDQKLVAFALSNKKRIESDVAQRNTSVQRIWESLNANKVPVLSPMGRHCVVIDVKQLPEFSQFEYPVASFVAWLYLHTGIRAGEHNVGMQKNSPLNGLVRLAVPAGLSSRQAQEISDRLVGAFQHIHTVPELAKNGDAREGFSDIDTRYVIKQLHNIKSQVIPRSQYRENTLVNAPKAEQQPVPIHATHMQPNDIAIVGMAGRYPKSDDMEQMWQNLVTGTDCIDVIPTERLQQRLNNGLLESFRGGFIDRVDSFDNEFFGISDKEAEIIDPQERQFLEVAWQAIEDAGYYPETLAKDNDRDVGVFVGAVWAMYQMLGVEEKLAGNNVSPNSFLWSIANRVSFWMDLAGPSLTLDTACSSSLTALKLACDSINSGECSSAIVGGVNLDLHQSRYDINHAGGSLSKDGVCRSFGKGANGYAQAEGVGALYIKSLQEALKDGDHIYGVIKSAVVNHSGRTGGYTIPNPNPQARLILKSLEKAQIDAASIGYIEAHGTATDFGDAIEISGLNNAYLKQGVAKQSCPIGSVKTNIGHTEAASGIVGIQKVLLQMKHRKLVPSLHSTELNENIDFPNSPFYVQQTLEDWLPKQSAGRLRGALSTFGAGGTNAHVIVEEFPAPKSVVSSDANPSHCIFPISARNERQLQQMAERLLHFITKHESTLSVLDIAYTMQVGRKSFDYRAAVLASDIQSLKNNLSMLVEGKRSEIIMSGHISNAVSVTGLLNAKEKQEFIDLLAKTGEPKRLARLWCDGVIPSWQNLGVQKTGRRIPLPTYPFAGNRFWISSNKTLDEMPRLSSNVSDEVENSAEHAPAINTTAEAGANSVHTYLFSLSHDLSEEGALLSELSGDEKAQLYVKELFAKQLVCSAAEVDLSINIMDSGVTSKDMAAMTMSIKEFIDPDFSPTAFFECTSIQSLSSLLLSKYESVFSLISVYEKAVLATSLDNGNKSLSGQSASSEEKINNTRLHVEDAEADLKLPDLDGLPRAFEEPLSHVMLTGATGFLGIHILADLLTSNETMRVICLVRAENNEHGLHRIQQQADQYQLSLDRSRIEVVCGDLNKYQLGLAEQDWNDCAEKTQQIIHASAHVNHIEGYATFRESTQGMLEILKLAATKTVKLIHFVSSISACTHKIGEEFSIYEKEDFVADGEQVYGGYGQSKWVQETFLKRAFALGIPYAIYRFGELSGSSITGMGQTDDMLHRLLQMRLAIGCREKISSDVLDMLPVDFAAKMIVAVGNNSELWNKIFHATHMKPYSFSNLYRKAEKKGLKFDRVTRDTYLTKCYEFVRYISQINSVNGFVLECVLRDAEGSVRNRKVMDGYFAILFPFDQNNFKQALQRMDTGLPEWKLLIDKYFERWEMEECGFMTRIQDFQTHTQNNTNHSLAEEALGVE
ncbi:thioester reductase domain-containing protein [Teredinibacter sp. KSP-S5-2]|uniref:thioester reductase domain-containing protein n=1 Tax=Teredinibacter sp. KSP-S5-2 TaxID=3034506 RepID=UPI0029343740|nr:thioester reductase domain-containing protein [Teredinibacter sp. KSP-S5-2]WNO11567.1 thioester reductase domain-containing protein [Teredinibacter sp. KSP-S5-2]